MISFFRHFFKRLLSRTRVNSKKLIVNQLRSQHQKAVLMTGFGINKNLPGLIPRGYPHKAIIDLLPAPATGCRLVLAQPNRLFFLTQDARIRFYATVMICHRRDCSVGLHILNLHGSDIP